MSNVLFRNGRIIDGAGGAAFPGDILIENERIVEVGGFEPPADAQVIDCTGLCIAPGFIDAHSHSDLQVLEDRREKSLQGVTAEIVGNCGFSPYPASADRRPLHEFANGIFCGDESWGWETARDYLTALQRCDRMANVGSLVGHGSLRIAQAGNQLGKLAERDVDAMEQTLSEALSDGACGFSTGLMYAPGASAPFEELERLCRVVARHDKVYASHIRSYSSELLEAIDEQIELAQRTGCKLQISHLQAVGHTNWAKQSQAIERIEKARDRGIDVAFDCYPYTAGSTVLTLLLPQAALEGGMGSLLARLTDTGERARIAAETVATLPWRWSDIYISAVGRGNNQAAVGRNIEEIAEDRESTPIDAVLDLIVEEQGVVNMLSFNQSEENLRQTLSHPLSIVISDAFYVKGRPHPRLHGTFPRLLGTICRERSWLTLEDAIHKITDRPARRFGLKHRGRLARGFHADLTVFDAQEVGSHATYESPDSPPAGIRYVFRDGLRIV